jgi:F1F0 ATPase subunit 2
MNMNDAATLLVAWIAGLLMGSVFFGGLWWTVRKGLVSQHPALWFIGSLILRMSLVLTGFYLITRHGNWQLLLSCLLGFIVARIAVMRLTISSVAPDSLLSEPSVVSVEKSRLPNTDAKESARAS